MPWPRPTADGAEAQAFAAVYQALQVRHWWEPFGLFHPRTPGWIEDLLAAIDRLARAD